MAVVVLIEGLVIALLGLLVVGLLRSHAEILRKLADLESGTAGGEHGAEPAPAHAHTRAGAATAARPAFDIVGTSVDDEVVKVGVLGARTDTLVAFLTSGCFTCLGFWEQFRSRRRLSVPGDARLVIVTKDAAEESPSKLAELAPRHHTVVLSSAAWEQYGVPVAPYFAYVDTASGTVLAGGGANGWDQVYSLWSKAVAKERKGERTERRGRARHDENDQELMRAGIQPGHPSLYPPAEED